MRRCVQPLREDLRLLTNKGYTVIMQQVPGGKKTDPFEPNLSKARSPCESVSGNFSPQSYYPSSSPIAAALAAVLGSDTLALTTAPLSPERAPAGKPAAPGARGHGACLIASPHRAS